MIAKIARVWRTAGLVRYLMGPGRSSEHTNQHVIAAWDGFPELHQPSSRRRGVLDVSELVVDLTLPALRAGIPQVEPEPNNGRVSRGAVWHCSLRNHAEDRMLSDAQWAEVVEDLIDRTGIARRDDLGACRWVAIRHAHDHVHIAAVLVRQDNGRRVHPRNDYWRAGDVCRDAEARLGLTSPAPADRTALAPLTRAEKEKAARRGQAETSREWLCRSARVAAVMAQRPEGYFRALADSGVLVRPREDPPGRLVGYAVAVPGDVAADGQPVWYSGRALARDLSLPQLLRRWASAPAPSPPIPPAPGEHSKVGKAERDAALGGAVSAIERATVAVASGGEDAASSVIHATEDMLNAVCAVTHSDRRSPAGSAADAFQRAARAPGVGQPLRWAPEAAQLRSAAWRLILLRALSNGTGNGGATRLIVGLSALLDEIAGYQQQRRYLAQARATRDSRAALPRCERSSGPSASASRAPTGPGRRPSTPAEATGPGADQTATRTATQTAVSARINIASDSTRRHSRPRR